MKEELDSVRSILPKISVIAKPFVHKTYEIELFMPTFSAICPFTARPDCGTISITYIPKSKVLEFQSFCDYLSAYKKCYVTQEALTNLVLEDVLKACNPYYVKVVTNLSTQSKIEPTIIIEYGEDPRI